jgi:hypothetical protein
MANKALTDDERARILELHAQGMPRNQIARETGRSAGTVTKVVHDTGGTFQRAAEVVAATEAKRVDNAVRRADMVHRLYDQAAYLLDRLEAPTFKVVGDSWGNAVVTTVPRDATPPADVRSLGATAVNMLQACARLEQVDSAKTGASEAKGILGNLATALQNAYDQLPNDEGTDEQG